MSPSAKREEMEYANAMPQDMSAGRYFATRFSTLKPPMHKAPNPIRLLRLLNAQQWLFFLLGFLGWTWDAFDFFTVSLVVENLAKAFGRSNKDITLGITLVLMMRSVGSITFGMGSFLSLVGAGGRLIWLGRYCCGSVWKEVAVYFQYAALYCLGAGYGLLQHL